jgi:hypothetical protein
MTNSTQFPGEFQAGDLIGGTYIVLGYLGRGAMGHLYHVRHNMLNSEYALKTLSSEKVTELDWKRFQNRQSAKQWPARETPAFLRDGSFAWSRSRAKTKGRRSAGHQRSHRRFL